MLGARGDVVGDFRHCPAKFRRSLGLAASDPQISAAPAETRRAHRPFEIARFHRSLWSG
jgi:hypothetical protein